MAKITITHISIENFGPFGVRQTMVMNVTTARPVILVKALNGSGKTTLLTALQIGLYGQKAHSSTRRSDYERMLQGMQRADALGNTVIEVGVTVEVSGAKRQLSVRREWHRDGVDLNERMSVSEGGSIDLEFSENWDEFISSILPAELVQLFLFDGEKIESLANPDRLPDLLRRATEVFLGIGGIDALTSDLKAFERRSTLKNKDVSQRFTAARADLIAWEEQVQNFRATLERLTQDQASARNACEQAQSRLRKFSSDAKGRGLAAYEQAAMIRSEFVQGEMESKAARSALADVVSNPVLPIAWLGLLWQRYETEWERHRHARDASDLGKEFRLRDRRIVALLSSVLPPSSVAKVDAVLAQDLIEYRVPRASKGPRLQDAPPREINRKVVEAKAQLAQSLKAVHLSQSVMERSEQRMGEIPAEEQIGSILSELQERSKAAATTESRLTAITQMIEDTSAQLNHAQVRLNAARDKLGTDFRSHSLEAKSLAAADRAKKTLALFKDRLLASKAQWLSQMITIEFRDLLRKKNLISRVIVDPLTYRVSIEDRKGMEIQMDRLSAGERQLLAISVLSALIKERKGRFPVVVDTPLARLDQQHRARLIKRFFATVSHQVVVLSTDKEVDGSAYDALSPFTSAEYSLDFDDVVGQTSINGPAKQRVH